MASPRRRADAAVQNHYSLIERMHEAVVDYCENENIVFVPSTC
jgi:aryl-alcohol dehydrogenase-like predicted oxidoreductase